MNMDDVDLPKHILAAVDRHLEEQSRCRGDRPTPRSLAVAAPEGELPMPPFPHPENPIFGMLLKQAVARLQAGASVKVVIIHIASHAWMEGHVEGFDYGYAAAEGS